MPDTDINLTPGGFTQVGSAGGDWVGRKGRAYAGAANRLIVSWGDCVARKRRGLAGGGFSVSHVVIGHLLCGSQRRRTCLDPLASVHSDGSRVVMR